jgi:hypothetical protein
MALLFINCANPASTSNLNLHGWSLSTSIQCRSSTGRPNVNQLKPFLIWQLSIHCGSQLQPDTNHLIGCCSSTVRHSFNQTLTNAFGCCPSTLYCHPVNFTIHTQQLNATRLHWADSAAFCSKSVHWSKFPPFSETRDIISLFRWKFNHYRTPECVQRLHAKAHLEHRRFPPPQAHLSRFSTQPLMLHRSPPISSIAFFYTCPALWVCCRVQCKREKESTHTPSIDMHWYFLFTHPP